jgi:hypothetical protein
MWALFSFVFFFLLMIVSNARASGSCADGLTWQGHRLGVSAGTPVQQWYFSTSERISCLQYHGTNNHRDRVGIGCHCVHHTMLYCYALIILSPIYGSFLITMTLISQRFWSSTMEACIRTRKWTFHVVLCAVLCLLSTVLPSLPCRLLLHLRRFHGVVGLWNGSRHQIDNGM